MIPEDVIEQVREAADLVGLVGEYVDLKRTGADYRGPCPFHGGTHRNFAVIPKKGRYYCFVCHASGDVFSWLMKRTGMDYPTAIREVALRTGIVIPERDVDRVCSVADLVRLARKRNGARVEPLAEADALRRKSQHPGQKLGRVELRGEASGLVVRVGLHGRYL